jgi:hypothetical protein
MAELFLLAIFHEIAPRVPVFEYKNDLPANLVVLAREVAIAVEETHSLISALVLLSADRELAGDPGSQAVAITDSPSLAPPLYVMLMMIGKELFLDIENQLLQSIHAIGAPFSSWQRYAIRCVNLNSADPRNISSRNELLN